MAQIIWKAGQLVNIRLANNKFTLAQMLVSPSMRFYDVSNETGDWENLDLNAINPLFRVYVSQAVVQNLVIGKIEQTSVKPSTLPFESIWIDSHLNFDGGFAFRGGDLIDIGPEGRLDPPEAPKIKRDLQLPADRKLIEQYELTNMWGPDPLRERLVRYFETGIDRDDLKFEVFPGLWDDREKLRPLTSRLPAPLR